MAQEVRNIDQRTPPTMEHRDRIPNRPVFVPPSDIYETKDSIVVLAEMPCVAPDGVDLTGPGKTGMTHFHPTEPVAFGVGDGRKGAGRAVPADKAECRL